MKLMPVLVNVLHPLTKQVAQARFDLPAQRTIPGREEFLICSIMTTGGPMGIVTPNPKDSPTRRELELQAIVKARKAAQAKRRPRKKAS